MSIDLCKKCGSTADTDFDDCFYPDQVCSKCREEKLPCNAWKDGDSWKCNCACMYTSCKPVQEAIRYAQDKSIEPHLDGDIGHE